MSCDRHYGIEGYPECSGHGQCVNGLCVCYPGWSSVGEFEISPGYDCEFNIAALKWIAVAGIIVTIPCLAYETSEVYQIVKSMNFLNLTNRQYQFSIGFFRSLTTIVYFCLTIYKRENFLLGKSVGKAVLLAFIYCLVMAISTTYATQLLLFLRGSVRVFDHTKKSKMLSILRKWNTIMNAAPVVTFIFVLSSEIIGIYALSPRNSDTIYIILCAIAIVYGLLYLLFLNTCCLLFIRELENYFRVKQTTQLHNQVVPDKEIASLLQNTKFIYRVFSLNLFIIITLYSIDAVWSFMRRKSTYSLLINYVILSISSTPLWQSLNARILPKEYMDTMKSMRVSNLFSTSSKFLKSRSIPVVSSSRVAPTGLLREIV